MVVSGNCREIAIVSVDIVSICRGLVYVYFSRSCDFVGIQVQEARRRDYKLG
jgi:hypothetical protein